MCLSRNSGGRECLNFAGTGRSPVGNLTPKFRYVFQMWAAQRTILATNSNAQCNLLAKRTLIHTD